MRFGHLKTGDPITVRSGGGRTAHLVEQATPTRLVVAGQHFRPSDGRAEGSGPGEWRCSRLVS